MILDGRSLASGSALTSRFCVVGTGMGGAAVAQKLAAAGHEVLLVEAGGFETRLGDSEAVMAEFVGRPFKRPPTRCIELGGTSNQWHGMCAPLDELDFEPRPWIPHSGWPFRRRGLDPFYAEAATLLGLEGATHFEPEGLEPRVRERLADVKFDSTVLENKLTQFRKPPTRWKNTLLARARAGQLRCLINAPALELLASVDGSRIERLVVGAGQGTISISADVFVICAGTLETPRLLLNSRRQLPVGVGNAHDLVGRFLLDHPTGHFCKLGFHRPTSAHIYTFRQIKGILTHRDILYRILVHRFGMHPRFRYADLFYFTEQLPNPNSRIGLSEQRRDRYGYPVARVDWQLTDDDFRAFQAYRRCCSGRGSRARSTSWRV